MGKTARQFNKMYSDYKAKFKKPLSNIAQLMPNEFTDNQFVMTFKRFYPNLWDDLEKQFKLWYDKNQVLIKYEKKSRYNFRKPYNFILDCSYHIRKKLRSDRGRRILSEEDKKSNEDTILRDNKQKISKTIKKQMDFLYLRQEIDPKYADVFREKYCKSNELHEKLEIIRELSKYKSDKIIEFFYKVNENTRNFHLKKESMNYIQGLGLPFVLRGKKKGKKNFIDNEIVKNESGPDILMQRLYVNELEKIKEFDIFISHNLNDENKIVDLYKSLNKIGLVSYVDWTSDQFDLKRQWCNIATSLVVKERIKQSEIILLFCSENILTSQWCPWEIGYADGLGKKICICNFEGIELTEYYSSYPVLVVEEGIYIIYEYKQRYILSDWIKK